MTIWFARERRLARTTLVSGVAIVTLSGVVACGPSRPDSVDAPIVVIGFDSADWHWIDPYMAEGRMPNMAALVQRGTRSHFKSLMPPEKSPTIWTSIATGKAPRDHGIGGFTHAKGELTGSLLRTAASYWEVLGTLGRSQAVIGWWVTFPATRVNGVLVSDYVQYFPAGGGRVEGAVYPEELWDEIDAFRVRPDRLSLEDLDRFIDVELARAHLEEITSDLERLKWIYAADESFRAIARNLYSDEAYDVFTVYFRGLDAVCHSFWSHFAPDGVGVPMPDWERAIFKDVIPAYHDYCDELLGEILGYVDPSSRVLVMSDHGFAGHIQTPDGITRGIGMHREHGILVMAGPDIQAGVVLEKSEVKDIVPTLLALCGVPLADDLPGEVLEGALSSSMRAWLPELFTNAVGSYEGIVPSRSSSATADEHVDQEILERLRSLGYID